MCIHCTHGIIELQSQQTKGILHVHMYTNSHHKYIITLVIAILKGQ